MLGNVIEWLLNPPSRLRGAGRFLSSAGFVFLVAGMYLRLAPMLIDMLNGVLKIKAAPATLATVYPGLSTWFIPEGPLGFGLATVVVAVGIAAQITAKSYENKYL